MNYVVRILPRAEKELAKLDKTVYEAIKQKIYALGEDPRPVGCRKLQDRAGWRVRVGNYRIVYEIEDGAGVVAVVRVAHRKDVYR